MLVEDQGKTKSWVASKFGVSNTDVSLALSLLRADPKIQQAVDEGRISTSAVEPLISQPLEFQARLVDAALREKTVRRVKALVEAEKRKTSVSATREERTSLLPDDVDPLEVLALNELREALLHLRNSQIARPTSPALVQEAYEVISEGWEILSSHLEAAASLTAANAAAEIHAMAGAFIVEATNANAVVIGV
jgi:hypothetical protein